MAASAVPVAAGAAASPAEGVPGGLAAIGTGLGMASDLAQERQQRQLAMLIQQAQLFNAQGTERQALQQQLTAMPDQASDPNVIKAVQRMYAQTGMPAPIDKGVPASTAPPVKNPMGGDYPTVTPRGPSVNASALYQLPYQQQVTDSDAIEKDFSTKFNAALKAGNTPAAQAAVRDTKARLKALGITDADIDARLDGYQQAGIADMSPQAAQALWAKTQKDLALGGKYKEDAIATQALLQPKIQALQAETQARLATASHLDELTKSTIALLPSKIAVNWSNVKKNNEQVSKDQAQIAVLKPEADFWATRAYQLSTGTDPVSRSTAINALTRVKIAHIAAQKSIQAAIIAAQAKLAAPGIQGPDAQGQINEMLTELKSMDAANTSDLAEAKSALDTITNTYGSALEPLGGGATPTGGAPAPTTPSGGGSVPSNGKFIPRAALEAIAKKNFGGDIRKAEQEALNRGYEIR